MKYTSHPISRVTLLQALIVVIGVLLTAASLKWCAYPESNFKWNPIAVGVRDFGFFLLLLPAVWALGGIFLERKNPDWWSPVATWISGFALIAVLALFFYWTVTTPFFVTLFQSSKQ